MQRYRSWSAVLRQEFGVRVQKITLDLGAGCPHRNPDGSGGCIFCDLTGGGSGAWLAGQPLREQLERGAAVARRRYKTETVILYFQSYSCTNLPLPRLEQLVEEALRVCPAHVAGLALGTRPDMVPHRFLDYLEDLAGRGLQIWLELGVQTIDEAGLAWLNRRHGLDAVGDTLHRCRGRRIRLCAHLISGLPGEGRAQPAESATWLTARGVAALKFHPLYVLRGTHLEELYRRGAYAPLTPWEYRERIITALQRIPPETIIQRLSADARPPALVAPQWVARKGRFLKDLNAAMEERDIRQGDLAEAPSP